MDDNQEIKIDKDDFIVSKTDPKGKITYCNRVFIDIAGYSEKELLGQPHNIIRHADMPRSVFRLMWNTLQEGHEFFGLIKNRTKSGKFYWALANVTPSYDPQGNLIGYYSVRRCPARSGVALMDNLYRRMLDVESQHGSAREAMDESIKLLEDHLTSNGGLRYEELVLSFADPDK